MGGGGPQPVGPIDGRIGVVYDRPVMFSRGRILTTRTIRAVTWLLQVAAIAVLYHLAARLGLTMASVQMNTSPFWPPAGIAVAALALLGFRVWPGITLGVLVGSLLTGADVPVAVGLAIGNTIEAVLCVFLLRRLAGFSTGMNRVVDVAWFCGVVLLTSGIGATAGVSTLLLAGRATSAALGSLWSTWWIGDLLGAVIVAPVVMVWRSPPGWRLGPRWFIEGLLGLLGVAALTWYVFAFRPVQGVLHSALIYAVFPLVIWIALRAGLHGATLAALVISGIATWGTARSAGPFEAASMNDALVLLQTFVAVVSLTALVLAAAAGERRRAINALRQRAEDLSTLNAATATFLTNQGVNATCATICRLAVESLGLDVAWIDLEGRDGARLPRPSHTGPRRTPSSRTATPGSRAAQTPCCRPSAARDGSTRRTRRARAPARRSPWSLEAGARGDWRS